MVIPLTHHKNSGFTELKAVGAYLSPAAGKCVNAWEKYGVLNYPFVYRILVGVLKG